VQTPASIRRDRSAAPDNRPANGCSIDELTDLERQYLHKRIAEEHAQLEQLEKSEAEQQVDAAVAAEVLGKRTGGKSHV
jgi:hypothetical protein